MTIKLSKKSASLIGSTGRLAFPTERLATRKDEEFTTRKDELLEENGQKELLDEPQSLFLSATAPDVMNTERFNSNLNSQISITQGYEPIYGQNLWLQQQDSILPPMLI